MILPLTAWSGVVHDRIGSGRAPGTRAAATVQTRQTAMPQQNFVPVRPISLRRKSFSHMSPSIDSRTISSSLIVRLSAILLMSGPDCPNLVGRDRQRPEAMADGVRDRIGHSRPYRDHDELGNTAWDGIYRVWRDENLLHVMERTVR